MQGESPGIPRAYINTIIKNDMQAVFGVELAQFPVTARNGEGVRKADPHNLCLSYQASSKGGGCNLAGFGSNEPGLVWSNGHRLMSRNLNSLQAE